MVMPVRQPDEVLDQLRQRFSNSYPDWARGKGTWPMRISLQPPSTAQRSASPVACHAWASAWATYSGPGQIEYAGLRFPTATHRMPKTLVIERPKDVAAGHPDDLRTWLACGARLTELQKKFPAAQLHRHVRRITELSGLDYRRLLDAATWLHTNPTSGMLLRQLPIEGIDTKWLATQATLILALLHDDSLGEPPDDLSPMSHKRALHHRLGLRVVPELIQITVCDPDLRAQFAGMRYFAATVEDLNKWPRRPETVVILENKETAFAVTDDHHGLAILHGHGLYVEQYSRIAWVRAARRVIYWGDIDAPGLQFVSDLRALGIPARTILTDLRTLNAYRHLAVDGAMPQRNTTPAHLAPAERELYDELTAYAAMNHTGLLLEQERIPWSVAYITLIAALQQPDEHISATAQ